MSETPHEVEEGRIDHDDMEAGLPLWSIVGILIAAAAIGYIIYDGLKSETYFYTVDQAIAQGADLEGQRVRIKGVVERGSIVGEDGQLFRKFRVAEKGKSLTVTYEKAMPDTFEEDREVVVLGTVNDQNVLEAEEVIVKCPSRYEGAPPTADEKPQASL